VSGLDKRLIEGYQLGLLFGLTPKQAREAIRLFEKVRTHPSWSNKRSNYALMVDCLYMMSKRYKTGVTVRKVVDITKKMRGKGTQPKLNEWVSDYEVLIA